ncbi:hypothetical protein C2857_004454 [Epichloe festucae Fl1]|uniref:Uncharacterized protein n=1 Tax=Epichloe festucae (strain Fl1) TaxID=877507 RepID=A0A7U3SMK2_EPIFF|nr:hypothetical protein C2857_004454 [Epichloe festucae Fl1]
MTTARLALQAVCAGRVCLGARIPIQPLRAIRFSSSGPATIADAGFWTSLIPKPFRKENRKMNKGNKSKEWNPATFFIIMFLFIGSMSIQMIALRNQSDRYNRQSTVRIGQLRQALMKLQNGEEVDVDKLLGNVDEAQKEIDWEEVLKAMERDEASNPIEQGTDKPRQPENQRKTATKNPPITKEVEEGEDASVESPATKSTPANLGSFF